MYELEDQVISTQFNGLKPVKLASKAGCVTLLIVLEKGHTSPEHEIHKHQTFTFPANIKHRVLAKENSKFLIIR